MINKDGSYSITTWGFVYQDEIKRTYLHSNGLPEKFGVMLKNQLVKYNKGKTLIDRFKDIIMVDPYNDAISYKDVKKMIDKGYIDSEELINNATRLNIDPKKYNGDIKTNWFNILNQWSSLGIKPYIEYDSPYMIDYDLICDRLSSQVNFNYIIDLEELKCLSIIGLDTTTFTLNELEKLSDKEFTDIIYSKENRLVFKDYDF